MGFYIRKGFNFGPLRLNLSRSGLGASIGIKGARLGVGPRGSYIHLGRGGFYYRQSLGSGAAQPRREVPSYAGSTPIPDISEIASAEANTIIDASATDLLQALNRIKRRVDIFPIVLAVGAVLVLAIVVGGLQWWSALLACTGVTGLAVAARHYDVTNGTVVLNYSLGPVTDAEFLKLRAAFQKLTSSHRLWHLDASGQISDWKRNAGASSLISKSEAQSLLGSPSKIVCNIAVPTLTSKRKALYFFPDRILVYDRSGVGAVSYSEIQATSTHTRFIEDGFVPSDSPQVGTTWRFVNKSGGPDRRFNNNRQLPILQYGLLAVCSNSGLNELFQTSAPEAPTQCAATLSSFGRDLGSPDDPNAQDAGGVSFQAPVRDNALTTIALVIAVAVMIASSIVLFSNIKPTIQASEETRSRLPAARQEFERTLTQTLTAGRHKNVSISDTAAVLQFSFAGEGPKAARHDGLVPFNKAIFFKEILAPSSEQDLCRLGLKALEITVNRQILSQQALYCEVSESSAGLN